MRKVPIADACACCKKVFAPEVRRRGRIYCPGHECRNRAMRERLKKPAVAGFQGDEAAAIAAALAAGKVTRIEKGAWPDTGLEELRTWCRPKRRAA